jgi:hypothetical protein
MARPREQVHDFAVACWDVVGAVRTESTRVSMFTLDPEGVSPEYPPMSDPGPEPTDDQRSPLVAPRAISPLRKRIGLVILVGGFAALLAYWSRNRPVDVEVVYDLGREAGRVNRLKVAFEKDGEVISPVEVEFPEVQGAPKRYLHKLTLLPGKYTVRASVNLLAQGAKPTEVRKYTRGVEIRSSSGQRITLHLIR